MVHVEVVDLEEEPDPPRELLADDGPLLLPVSLRQEECGRRAPWPDYHPPLGAAVIGQRGGVLDQIEVESADEEVDGLVVVVHDHRDLLEERHPWSVAAPRSMRWVFRLR
jgi:hypothetical protein